MGFAKLNVWFRDEMGYAICNENPTPDWNWVRIYDVGYYTPNDARASEGSGWRWQKVLDKPFKNVEMEIPPGAYIVQGHFCQHPFSPPHPPKPGIYDLNYVTDRVLVTATCGQEICVNLIVPQFATCIHGLLPPLLEHGDVGIENMRTTVATLLKAANIKPALVIADFEAMRKGANEIKAVNRVKIYDDAINILKQIK